MSGKPINYWEAIGVRASSQNDFAGGAGECRCSLDTTVGKAKFRLLISKLAVGNDSDSSCYDGRSLVVFQTWRSVGVY